MFFVHPRKYNNTVAKYSIFVWPTAIRWADTENQQLLDWNGKGKRVSMKKILHSERSHNNWPPLKILRLLSEAFIKKTLVVIFFSTMLELTQMVWVFIPIEVTHSIFKISSRFITFLKLSQIIGSVQTLCKLGSARL